MTCAKCGLPIRGSESYKHVQGMGDVHLQCPLPPEQAGLFEEEGLDVDQDASYPDWL